MANRIEINGEFYRMRRGVFCLIPEKWVGNTTHPQTIRKRSSKAGQGQSFKRKCMK